MDLHATLSPYPKGVTVWHELPRKVLQIDLSVKIRDHGSDNGGRLHDAFRKQDKGFSRGEEEASTEGELGVREASGT